tara:strand:- start:3842 stop:4129 length:288 start_codon:yes stop_codon:yes gene_type:complete
MVKVGDKLIAQVSKSGPWDLTYAWDFEVAFMNKSGLILLVYEGTCSGRGTGHRKFHGDGWVLPKYQNRLLIDVETVHGMPVGFYKRSTETHYEVW